MNIQESLLSLPKKLFSKPDPVWLGLLAAFIAVGVFLPSQFDASVQFVLEAFRDISLFLLLAVLTASYAMATGADGLIAKVFSGQLVVMVMLGALFGAFSPFCSCGVIPLIAALLSMGVHLAPVMAFWLASPLMDPTMFIITSGELGTEFAIAKTITAIGLGLMGGYVTLALTKSGFLSQPLREGVGMSGCCAKQQVGKPDVVWSFWNQQERRQNFYTEFLSTALFLSKWLLLAYLLESLMVAYVPASWVANAVGTGDMLSILTASLVGVPAYLNGYAAVPLVAGLLQQGMAPGAAMAFLIAGGVTSIPAAMAVFALARLHVFALYIVLSLSGAFLAGVAFQIFTSP
jgi:uncharacterized membrane protein YraQ (UPF0718 family)